MFSRFSRGAFVTLLTGVSVVASAQGVIWSRRLDYNGYYENPLALAVDAAGNAYVVGRTNASNTSGLLIAKYGPDGSRIWRKIVGSPSTHDSCYRAATDSQGNLIVAGSTGAPSDFLVRKIDPNGKPLWRRTYDVAPGYTDYVFAMDVDAVGNVVVAGTSFTNGTDLGIATIEYAPDGTRKWIRTVNSPYVGEVTWAAKTDASGNVYVVGTMSGRQSDGDVITMKYSPTGRLVWTQRYDGPYDMNDSPIAVAIDSLGNPVVLLTTDTWDGKDLDLVKYSPLGKILWSQMFGAVDRNEAAVGLALDPSDNALIVATSSDAVQKDFLTAKVDSDGALLWSDLYDSPYLLDDVPVGIVSDTAGNAFVTGTSSENTDYDNGKDFLTLKYSPEGTRKWVKRYDSTSHLEDSAHAIAVDPDGNVIVTGMSYLASIDIAPDSDFYTVKYFGGY